MLLRMPCPRILAFCLLCSGILLRAQDGAALDAQLKAIAAAHRGKVTLFAHNLRIGQTAAVMPDEPVQTASVIKLGKLLDAAHRLQIRHHRDMADAHSSTQEHIPERTRRWNKSVLLNELLYCDTPQHTGRRARTDRRLNPLAA
jgi:hypothetical protein